MQQAHCYMRDKVSAQLVTFLLAISAAGCLSEKSRVPIVRSPLVPFDELFVLEDTLRLDPTMLIGQIGFLDVSAREEILVTDHVANSVYLFSPSGSYIRSYSVPKCLPGNTDFHPWSTRFIGGGRIMTVTMLHAGSAVIFNADGTCFAEQRVMMPYVKAFCAYKDSIFAQHLHINEQAVASVYSPMLETIGEVLIEPPRLISLNRNFAGQRGRTIDCFDDGAYYVYAESMDAIPVDSSLSRTQYRPDFFEWRPEDLPETSPENQSRPRREYPSTIAVFALNGSTRMVVYTDLDSRWSLRDAHTLGISVASNTGQFPARSTISTVHPLAVGGGYLYAVGEHESLPNGEIGNPVILRYRFIPPQTEQ